MIVGRFLQLQNSTAKRDATVTEIDNKLKESESDRKNKQKEIDSLKEKTSNTLKEKESIAQKLQDDLKSKDAEIESLNVKIDDLQKVSSPFISPFLCSLFHFIVSI